MSSGKASSVGVNVGNSSFTFVCHSYFVFSSRRKSGRRHPCFILSVKHCAILIYVRQNEICQSKCQFECSNRQLNDCSKDYSRNAAVVFGSVSVFLDVRDNDCSGYEHASAKFERKACPVAQKSIVFMLC